MVVNEHAIPFNLKIIKQKKVLKLLGCVFYGDPLHSAKAWSYENEIGLLWNRLFKLIEENKKVLEKSWVNKNIGYEVHIEPDDYKKTKKYYIFVGMEVDKFDVMPLGMYGKVFPSTMYASFTFKGQDMFKGCDYIWKEWLPKSNYEEAHPFMIQAYNKERFFGLDDERSEGDFLIPIKPKKED